MNDPCTSQKPNWKIIKRVMNKCRTPKIPPLLVDKVFVLNCAENSKVFNDFFSKQFTPIKNSSVLRTFNFSSINKTRCYKKRRNHHINSKFKSQ